MSHGDIGPWNTVYRDGIPVAFIDWDAAQPVDPMIELAAAAWSFVPLAPPDQHRESGFDPIPELPTRLRLFVDAYGLADRSSALPALTQCKLVAAERIKHWPVGTAGAAGGGGSNSSRENCAGWTASRTTSAAPCRPAS